MKKRVAKIICSLLALQLVLGQSLTFVSANNTVESLVDKLDTEQSSTDSSQDESQKIDVQGSIEVTLLHTLKMSNPQKFDIILDDKETKTVYLNNSDMNFSDYKDRDTVVFDNLDEGEYEIQIKSDNFVTYKQTIQITNYVSKIYVTTDKVTVDGYGTMLYGDVNSDNRIDKDDANEVIDQIQTFSTNNQFDLNQDGRVDLIDLQFVTLKIGTKEVLSNIETTISNAVVSIEQGDNTNINGNINDLQSGQAIEVSVVDGTISKENPLQFSLNLATATTPLEVEGINIHMNVSY